MANKDRHDEDLKSQKAIAMQQDVIKDSQQFPSPGCVIIQCCSRKFPTEGSNQVSQLHHAPQAQCCIAGSSKKVRINKGVPSALAPLTHHSRWRTGSFRRIAAGACKSLQFWVEKGTVAAAAFRIILVEI